MEMGLLGDINGLFYVSRGLRMELGLLGYTSGLFNSSSNSSTCAG